LLSLYLKLRAKVHNYIYMTKFYGMIILKENRYVKVILIPARSADV